MNCSQCGAIMKAGEIRLKSAEKAKLVFKPSHAGLVPEEGSTFMAGSSFENELNRGEYEIAVSGSSGSMTGSIEACMCGQCLQVVLKPRKIKKKVRSRKSSPGSEY